MYKIDTPLDAKMAAAVARRQLAEEERKKRIFNPKERIYGKDYVALREQIAEKKAREYQERERERGYVNEQCRQSLLSMELDRRFEQDRRRVYQSVDDYRKQCQRFEDRREFDLNDPKYVFNSYPARLHDEDQRCGPASMQKFEGEDLSYKERITAQALQRKAALEAQLREKRMNEAEYNKAMELYFQHMREQDLRACQLYNAEVEAQRNVARATNEFNALLACEQKEKQALEKKAHDDATLAHIVNMLNSELLTETVDSTSVNHPHGVARDRFKGYSAERLAMIREEQRRQYLDKLRQQQEEKDFDGAWEKMKRREGLANLILDQEIEHKKRDMLRQQSYDNMQLARDHTLRQEYLNRILYKDTPTAEYFEQFNTTTR